MNPEYIIRVSATTKRNDEAENIIVDESVRGQGFGKKLFGSLLKKAFEMGAQHSYLQVVQTNNVALNLYKQFGFKKEYSYWYMKK